MEKTETQKRIEETVTNGLGFYDSPRKKMGLKSPRGNLDKIRDMFISEAEIKGNLIGTSPKYLGTYFPESDVTRGISEYGPWEMPGDVRIVRGPETVAPTFI